MYHYTGNCHYKFTRSYEIRTKVYQYTCTCNQSVKCTNTGTGLLNKYPHIFYIYILYCLNNYYEISGGFKPVLEDVNDIALFIISQEHTKIRVYKFQLFILVW